MPEEPMGREQLEKVKARDAWRKSRERRIAIRIQPLAVGGGVIAILLVVVTYILNQASVGSSITYDRGYYIAISALLFVIACIIGWGEYARRRREFDDSLLLARYSELADEEGKLLEEDQLRFGTLWNLTQERLRVYHEIATRQANASFRNAQYAIVAGFAVIIIGAFAVLFAKNIAASIVVGTLGTVGAALSAYIGKTFLRLQENAASHLRSYFDQPQEQFRYLSAERLLKNLNTAEERSAAVAELMRSIESHGK
jgi:hypothetical protein